MARTRINRTPAERAEILREYNALKPEQRAAYLKQRHVSATSIYNWRQQQAAPARAVPAVRNRRAERVIPANVDPTGDIVQELYRQLSPLSSEARTRVLSCTFLLIGMEELAFAIASRGGGEATTRLGPVWHGRRDKMVEQTVNGTT